MKQIFIFLAGSTIILFSLGLILSANLFYVIIGLVLFGFLCFWRDYWKVSRKINKALELRD
jgi:UDP-N-acetylmuramyl pentapeptide phosphotransferase/UDP-N-acetylglucosamine-1-phosphate transferase